MLENKAGFRKRTSNLLFGVEENGYRAVVHQLHFHVRLKNASFYRNSSRTKASDKFFIQPVGVFWRSGLKVRRPAATARVAIKRELGNDQRGTPDVHEGAVHFALTAGSSVGKNTQVGDFFREIMGGFHCIVAAHAEQDEHACLNFPFYS